jgi:undecaprenyl-diphosphatase
VLRWLLDYVARNGFALFALWRVVVGFAGLAALYVYG